MIRNYRGLLTYALLNYLDKALTFAAPLVVLYVFDDRRVYNEIEYVYSIAAIAAVLVELGVRNYFLYAYRESNCRDELVGNVRSCFLLQFGCYALIGFALLLVGRLLGIDVGIMYVFILARTLYIYFLSFFTVYFRLVDRPSTVFVFSISVSLITIGLICLAKYQLQSVNLWYFFAGQSALVLVALGYLLLGKVSISEKRLFSYMKEAIIFAWPIILNVFLFMFISNYGKIYAQNFLSQDEMFRISFAQRIAIIIHMAHVSIVGYLSKRVFIDEKPGIDPKVLLLYTVGILGSTVGAVALLLSMRLLDLSYSIDIDIVTLLIFGYTIAWCYVGFFELYVNRMNKNKFVLLFSCVSSSLFVLVLLLKLGNPLYNISLGMQLSMVCNLVLIVSFVLFKNREAKLC